VHRCAVTGPLGPCRAFGPICERVAAANPDIVFGKVNTEEEPVLAGQFNINRLQYELDHNWAMMSHQCNI
jgi:hypothetical protein